MAPKSPIQVEWFNVSYRSVATLLLLVVLIGGGGGGYWWYSDHYRPSKESQQAIAQASIRLAEATELAVPEAVEELVERAGTTLAQARSLHQAGDFKDSTLAAIRSENLSLRVISMVQGEENREAMVRFNSIEGDVRVKEAGEFSWKPADSRFVLEVGDQVKTSSSASAQLIYFDGTVTTIRPGSLMEIRDLYEDPVTKVQRVKERLSWGEVAASTRARTVSGSYHEVSTDRVAAKTEGGGEFQIAYNQTTRVSVIDVFDGRIEVANQSRKEVVAAGQRLTAKADGQFSPKVALPGVPRLLTPSDQRVFIFENPSGENVTLSWDPIQGIGKYRLIIASKPLFTEPIYDAERGETDAVIAADPGSYYWRVAAISAEGVKGPFSNARRFRVASQQIRDRTDTVSPILEVTEFVPVGQMVIINGRTEPGATLWVDNSKIDVYDDGSFNVVVRLRKEGLNELLLVAQDTAGNETTLNKSAYVELF